MTNNISNFLRSRLVQSILFWAASFFILLSLFSRTDQTRQVDYIYTFLFHIPLLIAVTLNSYLLIPQYLSYGKYYRYLTLFIALYAITYLNYKFTFNILGDWIFPGFYFIAIYTPLEILGVYIIYTGFTSLIEFSKSWFREIEMEKKMETLKKEKAETELKALRAQINPHFLFNSLNHIYALATQKAPETPEAVLQLSELLRYALRQTDKELAPLEDEIQYISQYVSLYKRRIHHPERVQFTRDGNFEGLSIAPLLLIVFVENCFKHGSVNRPGEIIQIHIRNNDGNLLLTTINAVDTVRNLPEESGGLGLENVRRRLKLLYPGKHHLEIKITDDKFEIRLELEVA